jgi:hypothetical protein
VSDPLFPGRSFFHGTKANLKNGDLIGPGFTSNYGQRATAAYVYLAGTLNAAIWGAELALGEGPGRIYVVEATAYRGRRAGPPDPLRSFGARRSSARSRGRPAARARAASPSAPPAVRPRGARRRPGRPLRPDPPRPRARARSGARSRRSSSVVKACRWSAAAITIAGSPAWKPASRKRPTDAVNSSSSR